MPNNIKHSQSHCGIISHARCVWLYFVLPGILAFGTTATLSAQENGDWGELRPDLINRRILILRHYDTKGYSVLPDTLRSPKDCCENETWVIVDTVTIPAGETVKVPSNVTVLFEPGTALNVQGALIAIGDSLSPIKFSIIDKSDMFITPKSGKPAWRGIYLRKNARLELRHVQIAGIDDGIISAGECDSVVLQDIRVQNTPQLSLQFLDNQVKIPSNEHFTLACPNTAETNQAGQVDLISSEFRKDFVRKSSIAGIGCIAVAAGALVISYIYDSRAQEFREEENTIVWPKSEIRQAHENHLSALDRRKTSFGIAIASGATGIALLVVSGLSSR